MVAANGWLSRTGFFCGVPYRYTFPGKARIAPAAAAPSRALAAIVGTSSVHRGYGTLTACTITSAPRHAVTVSVRCKRSARVPLHGIRQVPHRGGVPRNGSNGVSSRRRDAHDGVADAPSCPRTTYRMDEPYRAEPLRVD